MWVGVRNVAVIVAVYYLLPMGADPASWLTWVRGVVFLVGVVFVVWAVREAMRRQERAGPQTLPVNGLVLLAVLGVALFALADFVVATQGNAEFVGLRTRTDALYFAITTLATVGYGDIHPQGQLGRGLVIVQLVFNLVVLATAFSLLTGRLKERTRRPE